MADTDEVVITRLGAHGEGVAATDRGPLYVAGALPGERVVVAHREGGRGASGDHVHVVAVCAQSAERVSPPCRHFGTCGGCQLQHWAAEPYLAWKRDQVAQAFAARGLAITPASTRATAPGSRRRAVLAATRIGRDTVLGFHAARSHELVGIAECAVLDPRIVRALPQISALVRPIVQSEEELHVTVLACDNGLDVALETDKGGKVRAAAAGARTALAKAAAGARLLRVTLDGDLVIATGEPIIAIGPARVVPPPGAFLQASAEAERALVELIVAAMPKAKQVADLFCGLGTFTFHLAKRARVAAFDADRALITALETAARGAAGLKPITARTRDLIHDPLSPPELAKLDAVVFDPPRAGAAAQAAALARAKVSTVVAVSCNPATLARDVRTLVDGGYHLESVTPIDQFVWSAHVEAVAVLRR